MRRVALRSFVPLAVLIVASSAVACGLSSLGTGVDLYTSGEGGGGPSVSVEPDGSTSTVDGAVSSQQDGAISEGGSSGGDSGAPPGFPTHFGTEGGAPPTAPSLSAICAINTGTPSYTVCLSDGGTASVTTGTIGVVNGVAVLWGHDILFDYDVTVAGTRALAIIANGDVVVQKRIEVSAKGTTAGAGASATAGRGTKAAASTFGGGGGGFATVGGDGFGPSAGGAIFGMDPAVFQGGASGGEGGSFTASCGNAGGGGGALQISALGTITILGTLRANGGGGQGGCGVASNGGGGGGSGGAIFLEALKGVSIQGSLHANGAGGGSGGSGNAMAIGNPGEDGRNDDKVAVGGAALVSGNTEGIGGNGGIGATAPTAGLDNPSGGRSGGGGGAVGRVFIHKLGGAITINGTASPTPAQY